MTSWQSGGRIRQNSPGSHVTPLQLTGGQAGASIVPVVDPVVTSVVAAEVESVEPGAGLSVLAADSIDLS
ncbi:hypothetical protein [Nannocystis pusilla]|uniref:hypothetical protein n=1 Tax=Nannocystis pusilla TaxID=889268 RepID=UPI003DA5A6F7